MGGPNLNITTTMIQRSSRNLKAQWTIEAAQDLQAMHNINFGPFYYKFSPKMNTFIDNQQVSVLRCSRVDVIALAPDESGSLISVDLQDPDNNLAVFAMFIDCNDRSYVIATNGVNYWRDTSLLLELSTADLIVINDYIAKYMDGVNVHEEYVIDSMADEMVREIDDQIIRDLLNISK